MQLGYGYDSIILRIFYYDFRKFSCWEIFYFNVKIGVFKDFKANFCEYIELLTKNLNLIDQA